MPKLVVALLGSEGFIGSHVAYSCAKAGIPVFHLQKWNGDCENFIHQLHEINEANPDSQIILIHAAWYSTSNDDYRTSPENMNWVEITKTILKICKDNEVTFAGLGTCLEKLQTNDDIYTLSKSEIQNYLSRDFLSDEWIWFQIHYVYSARYLKPSLVKNAAEAIASGNKLKLRTPQAAHDFIEVRDAADAIVHSIITGQRGKIDIGTGNTQEVSYLLKAIYPSIEISKQDMFEKRKSYHGAASIERLVESGWKPKFSIG